LRSSAQHHRGVGVSPEDAVTTGPDLGPIILRRSNFMTTFNGLPAHALLVHFIVILAPLAAILAVLCAVWPAARRRLVWLLLALAVTTVALTPLTTDAGEWLEDKVGRSPLLHKHTEMGDTMIYFAVALLIAALLIAAIHVREVRGRSVARSTLWIVALIVIVSSFATAVQVYRIGDSGAAATWRDRVAADPGTPQSDLLELDP
jgi:ABC-type branched-subunit amino acid transport system permease subunit